MELFADLLVFDSVEGLNSTLKASELLAIPQSSVSRRYRQFANILRLQISRQSGSYQVIQGKSLLQQVRQLAQQFRYLHQLNRWAVHPAIEQLTSQASAQLPGQLLKLPQEYWEDWLDQRLIDQILDCRIVASEIPEPTEIHLALVLDPAQATQQTVFLGDWHSVDGIEDAVRAAGWKIAANNRSSETVATLKVVPAQQAFVADKPNHQIVAELALHWSYGHSSQQLDQLAETERQQFERLLVQCLCAEPAERAQNNVSLADLNFRELTLR